MCVRLCRVYVLAVRVYVIQRSSVVSLFASVAVLCEEAGENIATVTDRLQGDVTKSVSWVPNSHNTLSHYQGNYKVNLTSSLWR